MKNMLMNGTANLASSRIWDLIHSGVLEHGRLFFAIRIAISNFLLTCVNPFLTVTKYLVRAASQRLLVFKSSSSMESAMPLRGNTLMYGITCANADFFHEKNFTNGSHYNRARRDQVAELDWAAQMPLSATTELSTTHILNQQLRKPKLNLMKVPKLTLNLGASFLVLLLICVMSSDMNAQTTSTTDAQITTFTYVDGAELEEVKRNLFDEVDRIKADQSFSETELAVSVRFYEELFHSIESGNAVEQSLVVARDLASEYANAFTAGLSVDLDELVDRAQNIIF